MVWICGVDGCKSQWCAILKNIDKGKFCARVVPFQALLNLPESPVIVAVDLPIGMPDVTQRGGRACERLAREILGRRRACSVFSVAGPRLPLDPEVRLID